MAIHHSTPHCAPLGSLLLMISVLSSIVPDVQARPINFVCDSRFRKGERNNLKDLENAMLHQKRVEVAGALKTLLETVGSARTQSVVPCQTSLLERLERHVKNQLLIVSQLEIQEVEAAVASPSVASAECPSQPIRSQRLTEVLKKYGALLRGKLDRLYLDLQASSCPAQRRR